MTEAAPEGLRAAHDALAARLAVRRSIDHVRQGAYGILFSIIGIGLTAKLAYDRWWSVRPGRIQGRGVYLYLAAAAAILVLLFTIRAFLRARRLMAQERADFEELRALRARLGLDP
ncbi:MAG: hypothetical protein HZB56_00435 [Deltaproteobacteria bacterium]|nr:hypothetical protein [Deltaproteobacteria bacterium]